MGVFYRGIESFFREAFDGLKFAEGIEARLLTGAVDNVDNLKSEPIIASGMKSQVSDGVEKLASDPQSNERVVWCLPRTGKMASSIGKLTGRSSYAVEQWSSLPAVIREMRRFRPQVVFTSEANLMFLLRRFRNLIGVPFRVLYSNGGPVRPPFDRHDFVHQVAPYYLEQALSANEPSAKHILVPYGIQIRNPPIHDPHSKRLLRTRLGLPIDRPIVLSVGWIAKQHKRMDYVIKELANCQEPRPYLVMLGAIDDASPPVIDLAKKLLGEGNFAVRTVPYSETSDYYSSADLFVLGSLAEGFGRVYIEALMHGLPTIGHKHPVIEWVLGDVGKVADLNVDGSLTTLLSQWMASPGSWLTPEQQTRRWRSVNDRFAWSELAPQYVSMFRHAALSRLP